MCHLCRGQSSFRHKCLWERFTRSPLPARSPRLRPAQPCGSGLSCVCSQELRDSQPSCFPAPRRGHWQKKLRGLQGTVAAAGPGRPETILEPVGERGEQNPGTARGQLSRGAVCPWQSTAAACREGEPSDPRHTGSGQPRRAAGSVIKQHRVSKKTLLTSGRAVTVSAFS